MIKTDPATFIIAPYQQLSVRGGVSSQFLSAVLMALPLLPAAQPKVMIKVDGELISKPYIDLTISLMARFGVQVEREGWQRFTLAAGSSYQTPGHLAVEGDASSASYFLAAGAVGGGPLRVTGVGAESRQGDIGFANVLTRMGANVMMGPDWIEVSGATHRPCRLKAIDMDFNLIPDAAMTVAVLALFAEGTSTLRNIASWRVKETDRLAAMATELRKLGATVDAGADFLRITPPATLTAGAEINTEHAKQHTKLYVPVIAIDGPTASGKGTVAQQVAKRLGFDYLDSGALYRLLALASVRRQLAVEDVAALTGLARELDVVFRDGYVKLDGANVSDEIRAEAIGNRASEIATHASVRQALIARQRAFRTLPGLVADGRDMDLAQRDARDIQRANAPLKPAEDAKVLDTSSLCADQVTDQILEWFAALSMPMFHAQTNV
ncbi:hypothetical protein BGZ96_004756 [Linnemannia gamsii]|uniref:3-phosphoshikimate 1-carboxyvinyltransferase n=1 Tax=Linnemannia gamsii TaxID=64522 RepID=A0ABQ7K638_9FUNG|nr:hypothetical protein BGZ96_004756 [Linnemannia gamsii]